MKIIEYENNYRDKLIELLIDVVVNEYGFKEWEEWIRNFENEGYKSNGGNCWIVIDESDNIMGTISLKNIDNLSGEIKNLYIYKQYRGKGLAKILLKTLTEFAIESGYKRLQLDTYSKFDTAIKFYEKNKFKLERKEDNKYIYSKMLQQDKISVIVPIYNLENNVEVCIKSIINQTYKNLQIVLIDDGSKDKSGEICDNYEKQDKRIKVIHKVNSGLADVRNTGMDIAEGRYISFIDGDDYIYPTFYEELLELIQRYDADISECQFLRINEQEVKNAEKIINDYNSKIDVKQEVYDGQNALELLYGTKLKPYVNKVVVWNKLYKKELFDDVKFPKGKLHEDEYTTYKILDKCNKIVSINKVLHGYIQTNNSIMRVDIKQKRIDDNLDAYKKCSEYFEEKNNKNLEMKCRRRYLENCIELAGKVLKTTNEVKKQQIDIIQKRFVENYDNYIDNIKTYKSTNREKIIIEDIIIQAYNSLKSNKKCIGEYWGELEQIINEN